MERPSQEIKTRPAADRQRVLAKRAKPPSPLTVTSQKENHLKNPASSIRSIATMDRLDCASKSLEHNKSSFANAMFVINNLALWIAARIAHKSPRAR
jgi:hypothetical protein